MITFPSIHHGAMFYTMMEVQFPFLSLSDAWLSHIPSQLVHQHLVKHVTTKGFFQDSLHKTKAGPPPHASTDRVKVAEDGEALYHGWCRVSEMVRLHHRHEGQLWLTL